MKRYDTIYDTDFQVVKEIPCATCFAGKVLTDCYKTVSRQKMRAYAAWESWKNELNNGNYAHIESMFISSHTCNFFTLVFKGYLCATGCRFIAVATGRNNYIQYLD